VLGALWSGIGYQAAKAGLLGEARLFFGGGLGSFFGGDRWLRSRLISMSSRLLAYNMGEFVSVI